MENDKLFEFMEKMYSDFSKRFDGLENEMEETKSEIGEIKSEVRKTNNVIESDIKPKINALFDGYQQLNEKTTRIENQVSKHDEIIIKRVK